MRPELKEGQYISTIFILSGRTVLKEGEVFDEFVPGEINDKGENLYRRSVGDGVTKYKDLPKEEFYDIPDKSSGADL